MIVVPGRRTGRKSMSADTSRWVSFLLTRGYILACAAAGIAITICLVTELVK